MIMKGRWVILRDKLQALRHLANDAEKRIIEVNGIAVRTQRP